MSDVVQRAVSLESPTQSRTVFGSFPCQGTYHSAEGSHPTTALIATHYVIDFGHHYLAEHMARRGYGFLGWNTRYQGAGAPGFTLEHAIIDIGVGVRWLREQAGVETVVILGNSGGASLMGAYQAQAIDPHLEAGTAPPEELADLPAADLYVALAAHTGRPQVLTEWLDPSVTDEGDPLSVDPELDMFNPDNGPPYAPEFVARYRAAQVERNERITQWAERELERVGAAWPGNADGRARFDRFFSIPRMYADLRFLDLTLDPSDREVGCYMGDAHQANYSGYGLTPTTSAREWLSMWSLSHSQANSEEHLPRIHQPALVISASRDQGCFPSHARALHDQLGSADKRLVTADGNHFFTRPEGARAALADLIASWLAEQGAAPS